MLFLLSLYLCDVVAALWGYPQCTEALCLGPLIGENQPCATNDTCPCRSLSYLSDLGSCVATLCPDDQDKVYITSKNNCNNSGFPHYPLDALGWISVGHSSWTSLLAGHWSTPPAAATVTWDIMNDSPEYSPCTRDEMMCV